MKTLSDKEWNNHLMPDIFKSIQRGKRLKKADHVEGFVPYVSSTANNNGVDGYIEAIRGTRVFEDCISLANSGSVGKAFYEPFKFVASDHVTSLKNDRFNKLQYLFIASSIEKQGSNFNFNREINDDRIKKMQMMLPVTDDGEPDYDYMSDYVREYKETMLAKYRNYAEKRIAEIGGYIDVPALDEKGWGKFDAFGEDGFFEIATTSSSIDGIRIIDGDDKKVPYVTRTDTNNGIARFVSDKNYDFGYDKAGCITVGLDTQTAFWQSSDFVTGQNIQVITSNILNPYLAQFVIPLFRSQMKAKFNWGGNGATLGRMKRLELMLPINDLDKPDFEYMEQYAKNMMLRKYKQYLIFLKAQTV